MRRVPVRSAGGAAAGVEVSLIQPVTTYDDPLTMYPGSQEHGRPVQHFFLFRLLRAVRAIAPMAGASVSHSPMVTTMDVT